jgi:putative hydrolase of the HAD superfamily
VKSCVVFDLDDTLYLERDYVHSGFRAVGLWVQSEWGIEGFAARAYALFEEGMRGGIFDRVLQEIGIEPTPQRINPLVHAYRNHAPAIELSEDARPTLMALSDKCRLACITDGPLESQSSKARALELDAWLDPIVFTAALGKGFEKPSRKAFEIVQAATATGPHGCVYVADNPAKDFQAPVALGWRTVRVRRSGGLHCHIPSGPEVLAEMADLSALPDFLGV